MDKKSLKFLQKLKMYENSGDYVSDKYTKDDMIKEIANNSSKLTPEDVRTIHFAESSGGKDMENPTSSASGHFQHINSTEKEVKDRLFKQLGTDMPSNPDRLEAAMMSDSIKNYERVLKNSKKGQKEPNLENIYTLHKTGIQGGLNVLNDPKTPENQEKMRKVKAILRSGQKKSLESPQEVRPAKNLLELLED